MNCSYIALHLNVCSLALKVEARVQSLKLKVVCK